MNTNQNIEIFPPQHWAVKYFWLIGIAAIIMCVSILVFSVIGTYEVFWGIENRNVEIKEITQQLNAWKDRAKELEELNNKLKVTQNFENLFLLATDINGMLDMKEIENWLCERRGLCEDVITKMEILERK